MRKIIGAFVLLALLWSGWWWVASTTMVRVIDAQMDQMRSTGWQISTDPLERSGYPFELHTQINNISLTDPEGVTLVVPDARLVAKAYWPGHLTLHLPNAPMVMSQDAQPVLFAQVTDAVVTLKLAVSPSLGLRQLSGISGPWQVNAPNANILSAADATLDLSLLSSGPSSYAFALEAQELSPGDVVRAALQADGDVPLTFDAYRANGHVTLERPLDRHVMNDSFPPPTALNIERAELNWGALGLDTSADLNIDAQGIPDGTLTARVSNWRTALDYAVRAGVLGTDQRNQAQLMLNIFANMSGDPEDIDVTLTAQDGQLRLNSINLGAAPRLFR